METHLKERLVGAAVLVAVGVLVIPEMLSGPQPPIGTVGQAAAESGVRRYTIDLARPPAAEALPPVAEPPVAVTEAPSSAPEVPQATVSEATPSEPPARVVEAPAPAPPPVAAPAAPAAAARLPWAVQVGSFSAQATAERVSNELKARGYESFVVPFRTGTQTLYRVRIGPMPDRDAAEAAVQKLKREGTGATVVANS